MSVFHAVVIHFGSLLQINTLRRTDARVPVRGSRTGDDRLTWVGPGTDVNTGSSGRSQPLGQMVRSRVIATVHQTHPLASSCLAMAPSITSQWNERKLAPNYRLLSVKNGTGAAGVCQRVEAGWLTHCGTEACTPRRGHAEHTHRGHGGDTRDYTHICAGTHTHSLISNKRLNLLASWVICASAGFAPSPMWMQQKPLVFHL